MEFQRDFLTLFKNAFKYNIPGSQIYQDALILQKEFQEEFETIFNSNNMNRNSNNNNENKIVVEIESSSSDSDSVPSS